VGLGVEFFGGGGEAPTAAGRSQALLQVGSCHNAYVCVMAVLSREVTVFFRSPVIEAVNMYCEGGEFHGVL
jgi:hypothetical protein